MNADLKVSLIDILDTTGDKYAIKLKIANFDKSKMDDRNRYRSSS